MKKLLFKHTGHEQDILAIEHSVDRDRRGRLCWLGIMMSRDQINAHAGDMGVDAPSIGSGGMRSKRCLYLDKRFTEEQLSKDILEAEGDFRWIRLTTDDYLMSIVGDDNQYFDIIDQTTNEEACLFLQGVAE